MRFIYPAIFEKKEDGTFHASFPDLEDCEPASYPDEIHLANDRQSVHNILVHYRMVEGWDE